MRTLLPLTLLIGLAAGPIAAPARAQTTSVHGATSGKTKTTAKATAKATTKSTTKSTAKAGAKTTSKASAKSTPKAAAKATAKSKVAAKTAATAPASGRRAATSAGVLAEHPTPSAETGAASETSDALAQAPATAVAPSAGVTLRDVPDGRPTATLTPQSTLVPLAHDRGWVRVRAEGWVKESEVSPVDPARVEISAADLRADPDGARGKVVHWDVEVLAMQTADPLRKGLAADEPYLLVRGPGAESALLYVAVPPSLLATARTMASVAPVAVTLVATVRAGRSEPVGVPILDAQSLARR
jgi:hypothetical protein